jgi:hypothetical protein
MKGCQLMNKDGSNDWDPATVGMSSTSGMPPKAIRQVTIRDTSKSKDASNRWGHHSRKANMQSN